MEKIKIKNPATKQGFLISKISRASLNIKPTLLAEAFFLVVIGSAFGMLAGVLFPL